VKYVANFLDFKRKGKEGFFFTFIFIKIKVKLEKQLYFCFIKINSKALHG
jgi:hypothetical protein